MPTLGWRQEKLQELSDFLRESEKVYFKEAPISPEIAVNHILTGLRLLMRVAVEYIKENP